MMQEAQGWKLKAQSSKLKAYLIAFSYELRAPVFLPHQFGILFAFVLIKISNVAANVEILNIIW